MPSCTKHILFLYSNRIKVRSVLKAFYCTWIVNSSHKKHLRSGRCFIKHSGCYCRLSIIHLKFHRMRCHIQAFHFFAFNGDKGFDEVYRFITLEFVLSIRYSLIFPEINFSIIVSILSNSILNHSLG